MTYQTAPVRVANGGRFVDTVLYVVNPTPGATTAFSDDEGVAELSKMSLTASCSNCYVISGEFGYPGNLGNYDLWIQYDPDSDGDFISDNIEQAKGTDIGNPDTDSDGLIEYEELIGVNASSLAGFDASLVMPWQDSGADPKTQDLFVQVDFMTASDHSHDPRVTGNWTTFAADLVQVFQTDSSFTGRTIVPHVMIWSGFSETTRATFGSCSGVFHFYDRKNNLSFFDPLRASIFHYLIFAHSLRDETSCADVASSGEAEIWGNDVMVALGLSEMQVGTVDKQRGAFVHELGHNLGLVHNLNNSNSGKNSCVHTSPMNYRFNLTGTPVSGAGGMRRFSYSRGMCDGASLGGCTNSCVPYSLSQCVPTSQTSPKQGCSPNTSGCDCDKSEWSNLRLDIPASYTMSFKLCQLDSGSCNGSTSSGARSASQHAQDERYGRQIRQYFLNQPGEVPGRSKVIARERKRLLLEAGLKENVDFRVHPVSERLFSIE